MKMAGRPRWVWVAVGVAVATVVIAAVVVAVAIPLSRRTDGYEAAEATTKVPQQNQTASQEDKTPEDEINPELMVFRSDVAGSLVQDVAVVVYNAPSGYHEGDVGSPTIIRAPPEITGRPGVLLAANDMVGQPVTQIHRSDDNGLSWALISTVPDSYWCSLLWHKGDLYLLGTSHEYGDVHVWHSEDVGVTWSVPDDGSTGKLTSGEKWHRAPTPFVQHNGRLWHAMESMGEDMVWPSDFSAVMWSIDEDGDLLDASQWRTTNHLPYPSGAFFGGIGWLEGNAAVTPDGGMAILIRVHNLVGGAAAIIDVDAEGKELSLNKFVTLPGGCKKFMIEYDAPSGRLGARIVFSLSRTHQASFKRALQATLAPRRPTPGLSYQLPPHAARYWTLANTMAVSDWTRGIVKLVLSLNLTEVLESTALDRRNLLSLMSSPNLENWTVHEAVIYNDTLSVGYQYPSSFIEESDMYFALRVAKPYKGQVPSKSKAGNLMTFHRLHNFRTVLAEALPFNGTVVKIRRNSTGPT